MHIDGISQRLGYITHKNLTSSRWSLTCTEYFVVSLNGVLLTGPDSNNLVPCHAFGKRRWQLLPMFYCFLVNKDHRQFLSFLWYEDNDLDYVIVEC